MRSEKETSLGNESNTYLFNADTSQQEIDSVVWTAFKSGDRRAFDYIFQKYVKLLYAYGGKITRDQNLVEDCIQDLFVELWQKREVLSEVVSVKFYLLKSLRRRVIRRLSSEKGIITREDDLLERNSEFDFPLEFKLIEEQKALEQHGRLLKALSLLTRRQREAIHLKFYEKISYEELAEIMNLGVKSAYNIIGKAIDSLRKHI
jgi:RNA polymerase sigma factor (sigma-70 family)